MDKREEMGEGEEKDCLYWRDDVVLWDLCICACMWQEGGWGNDRYCWVVQREMLRGIFFCLVMTCVDGTCRSIFFNCLLSFSPSAPPLHQTKCQKRRSEEGREAVGSEDEGSGGDGPLRRGGEGRTRMRDGRDCHCHSTFFRAHFLTDLRLLHQHTAH